MKREQTCGLVLWFIYLFRRVWVGVWVVVVWFSDKLFILLAKTLTVKKILELGTKILELGKYHPLYIVYRVHQARVAQSLYFF